MKKLKNTQIRAEKCLKIRHFFLILGAFYSFFILRVEAQDLKNTRVPASSTYRQNMIDAPPAMPTPIINRLLMEDEKGVLRSVRENTERWNNQEQMAENWNMESSGLYDTPSDEEKGLYYKKSFLKYLEKRFLGEVKRQGKTVFTPTKPSYEERRQQQNGQDKNGEDERTEAQKSVSNIKKVLGPTASSDITKNTKLKMRLRPLQGRVFFVLQNPYADTEVRLSAKKEAVMNVNKNFEKVGLGTSVNYQMTQKVWSTQINKTITETVSAQISSSQKASEMAFSGSSAKVFQVVYNLPF